MSLSDKNGMEHEMKVIYDGRILNDEETKNFSTTYFEKNDFCRFETETLVFV